MPTLGESDDLEGVGALWQKYCLTSSMLDNWVLQAFDEFVPTCVGRPRRYKRATNLKTFFLLLVAGTVVGVGGMMVGFSLNSVHELSAKCEAIEGGLNSNVPPLRQGELH
jgi:hypothetical protein